MKTKKILALILSMLMVVSLLPVTALADTTHTHDGVTFDTPIEDLDDLKTLFANGGSGYLTKDITADDDLTVDVDVIANLCLNGHVIDLDGHHIVVCEENEDEDGAIFNLYDCGKTEHYFKVESSGLWTLLNAKETGCKTVTGGVITGGTDEYGGGVEVEDGGKFNLYAGTICGNTATKGGGVEVETGGTFNLYAGTICGNTATKTGGGIYNEGGTVTVHAGTICDNTATEYAGGIQNNRNTLKLLAAEGKEITITGNTAATGAEGGVANWGEMHLSGKVIIKDNICTNKYDTTVNYPINLATKTPIIIDGPLTGSEIYITHADNKSDNHDTGVLTSGYIEQNEDAKLNDFFHYDGPSAYYMVLNEDDELEVKEVPSGSYAISIPSTMGGVVTADKQIAAESETVTLTVAPDKGYQLKTLTVLSAVSLAPPITPTRDAQDRTKYTFEMPDYPAIVTAEFEGSSAHIHNEIDFEPWGDNSGQDTTLPREAGDYYLTQDILLEEVWAAPEGVTNICLNGHVINQTDGEAIIEFWNEEDNTTVNIYDCDTETEHYFTDGEDGLWIWDDTLSGTDIKHTVKGGVITSYEGYGVFDVYEHGNLALYGGTIAGVYNAVACKNFDMYGGNICGNSTYEPGFGAGVTVSSGCIFNMYGGAIFENSAYRYNKSEDLESFTGGVYVSKEGTSTPAGQVTIGGNAKITGNKRIDEVEDQATETRNLFLEDGCTIALGTGEDGNGVPVPDDKMSIGITMQNPHGTKLVSNADSNSSKYFTCDESACELSFDSDSSSVKMRKQLSVKVNEGIQNGSVSVTTTAPYYKDSQVGLSVTPNSDYKIKRVSYNDGEEHEINVNDQGEGVFAMPGKNVIVTAEFEKVVYTITYTGDYTGTDTVEHGGGVTLPQCQDEGYHFTFEANGQPWDGQNITGDVTVTVTKVKNTYTVTYTGDYAGTDTVDHGSSVTLPQCQDEGYHFTFEANGQPWDGQNVTSGVTVTVTKVINTYTITYTGDYTGTDTANHGSSVTLPQCQDEGYDFTFEAGGKPWDGQNITSDVTVTVTKVTNQYADRIIASLDGFNALTDGDDYKKAVKDNLLYGELIAALYNDQGDEVDTVDVDSSWIGEPVAESGTMFGLIYYNYVTTVNIPADVLGKEKKAKTVATQYKLHSNVYKYATDVQIPELTFSLEDDNVDSMNTLISKIKERLEADGGVKITLNNTDYFDAKDGNCSEITRTGGDVFDPAATKDQMFTFTAGFKGYYVNNATCSIKMNKEGFIGKTFNVKVTAPVSYTVINIPAPENCTAIPGMTDEAGAKKYLMEHYTTIPVTVQKPDGSTFTYNCPVKEWNYTGVDPYIQTDSVGQKFTATLDTENAKEDGNKIDFGSFTTTDLIVNLHKVQIKSITAPEDINAKSMTAFADLGLPSTVTVTDEIGRIWSLPVQWESTDYNMYDVSPDGQNINGSLNLTGMFYEMAESVLNETSVKVTLSKVKVTGGDVSFAEKIVPYGTAFAGLALPTSADVTTEGGSVTLPLTWNPLTFDATTASLNVPQTVEGSFDLTTMGFVDLNGTTVSIPVMVRKAEAQEDATATAITNKYCGTAFAELGLPTAVDVVTETGTVSFGVTWNSGDYNSTLTTEQTIEGTLNAPEGYLENGKKATVKVTLLPKQTVTVTAEADGFTYGDNGKIGYKNVSVQDNLVATSDLDITYYLADGTTKTNTTEGASVEGGMPKNAGAYKVVISVPEANKTYAGSKTIDFTIDKKAVTVSGIAVQDKTYNGKTDDATIVYTGISFTGKLGSDTLTISGITGTYANANASDTQTVNLNASTNWTLGGASVANYMLATEGQPASVTGKISKATPTLSNVQATAITYGQTLADSTVTGTATNENKTSDKTVAGTFVFTAGETTPAVSDSENTIYVVTFTPTDGTNYNNITTGIKLKVNKADYAEVSKTASGNLKAKKDSTVEIILPTIPSGASYGTVTNSNTALYTIDETNKASGKLTLTAAKDFNESTENGDTSFTVSVEPDGNHNGYDITVTVTPTFKTPVTVSAEADGFTYGDNGKIGYKNVSVQDSLVATSDLDITYYLADGTTKTNTTEGASVEGGMPKNAGAYKVVISVPEANETYAGSKTVDFTIAKKAVTVKANNKTLYIGDSFENGTESIGATITGLLNGDSLSEYSLSCEVPFDEAFKLTTEGTYPVVVTVQPDAAGNNYTVTSVDGTLTVSKKSSGGGSGSSSYTVKFDTNGGEILKNVSVRVGQKIGTIETPKKEGFVFDGWFSDKELTKPYNADDKVTKSTTLYANWKVDPIRQITLTIGQKEATVFTEEKANDVAPIIRNERTMLPIRFVAEALGATVNWDSEKKLVTISSDDLIIEITIGENVAFVNGEEVILDSPAFIENDRTYLPLRFVAENLGASVEWFEESQRVVITKAIPEKTTTK